jgi:hypothetical protein
MALKLDYVVRETGSNLRRNITLSLAAIVTVGVSLSLFGSALLLQQGVENVSGRWQNDIELIVFLNRDITEEQQGALEQQLNENPEIERVRYVNEEESREEALRLFERNDAMLRKIRRTRRGCRPRSGSCPPRRTSRRSRASSSSSRAPPVSGRCPPRSTRSRR